MLAFQSAHYGGWAAFTGAYVPFWKVKHAAGLICWPGTGVLALPLAARPVKVGDPQAGLFAQLTPANVVYRPSWFPPSPALSSPEHQAQ